MEENLPLVQLILGEKTEMFTPESVGCSGNRLGGAPPATGDG